jgi:IPT/TIG domain
VLQNGVWSNGIPFVVNTLHLGDVSPASGVPGTSVTMTGTGFGSSQGSGTVQLGSVNGLVVSWSDTQIVATVAPSSLTGIARVQQNGGWSNAVVFTVPGGTPVTVVPNLLNMVVGETHTIQALNAAGQPVTGLAWISSDPNVVSLSSDNPPGLSALAAGHVTITAGAASADVTVFAGALPLGTVIWSNPGNGSGVTSIVPAVPSPSGVADVFAFQSDGTVQAITSNGATAWSAGLAWGDQAIPDFQGGLVVQKSGAIVKVDGLSGQQHTVYTPGAQWGSSPPVVHPDGTIFAIQNAGSAGWSVVGLDPAAG